MGNRQSDTDSQDLTGEFLNRESVKINHVLVDKFLHRLKDTHKDNDEGYFFTNGGCVSNGVYRIMEIMFNSFLEARSQIYDTNNQVRVDTETAGEKVKRIHKLYGLFKGVDGNNRQLAELTDKFGEFCKIIEVREFIFREIINELKSMHIHRNNRNDLYTLLSAMDSDYVFRYGYLHNHNISRKIFDDIFRQIKISTGNNANKTDGDENHGDEIQME